MIRTHFSNFSHFPAEHFTKKQIPLPFQTEKMTKKILIHCVLVALFLMIPVLSSPDFDGSFRLFRVPMMQREFLEMVLIILFFYLNYLFLVPHYFNRKKYFSYVVMITACYAVCIFAPKLIGYSQVLYPHFPNPHSHKPPPPKNILIPIDFFRKIIPFAFALLSSFYLRLLIQNREAETQKSRAELLSLKYQLQPHFLFNILNNIYSLSLLKSDAAPESILKLSNVMRYVVNEYDKDEVLLKDETAYLEDYIALQLMRTDENLEFDFNKNIGNENLKIAPMILVSFIENAFKYGFNAEENSKISINISTSGNTLFFKIKNKIVNHSDMEDSSKIGMKNTMEQLNYLYPNRYILDIKNDSEEYSVDLKIDLIS